MPNVWIDLCEFDDDDLVSELESRGYVISHKDDKEYEDEDNERMKDELYEVLRSWEIDPPNAFERNMRIFNDRWFGELKEYKNG